MRIYPTQHIEYSEKLTVEEAIRRGFVCKMGETYEAALLAHPVRVFPGQLVSLEFLTSSGIRAIYHTADADGPWVSTAGAAPSLQAEGYMIGSRTCILNAFWVEGTLVLDYGYLVFPDEILRLCSTRDLIRFEYRRRLRLNKTFAEGVKTDGLQCGLREDEKYRTLHIFHETDEDDSYVLFSPVDDVARYVAKFEMTEFVDIEDIAIMFATEMKSGFGDTVYWSSENFAASGYYHLEIAVERGRSIHEWASCIESLHETMSAFDFKWPPLCDMVSYLKSAGVRFSSIYADSDNHIQGISSLILNHSTSLSIELPGDPKLFRKVLKVLQVLFTVELAGEVEKLANKMSPDHQVSSTSGQFKIDYGQSESGKRVIGLSKA